MTSWCVVYRCSLLWFQPTKAPSPKEGSLVKEHASPHLASAKDPKSAEDEYKAKMAERRRQAREKAEREAEEERMKNEEFR